MFKAAQGRWTHPEELLCGRGTLLTEVWMLVQSREPTPSGSALSSESGQQKGESLRPLNINPTEESSDNTRKGETSWARPCTHAVGLLAILSTAWARREADETGGKVWQDQRNLAAKKEKETQGRDGWRLGQGTNQSPQLVSGLGKTSGRNVNMLIHFPIGQETSGKREFTASVPNPKFLKPSSWHLSSPGGKLALHPFFLFDLWDPCWLYTTDSESTMARTDLVLAGGRF